MRPLQPPGLGASPPCFPPPAVPGGSEAQPMPSRGSMPEQRCLGGGMAAPRVTFSSVSGFGGRRVQELSPRKQGSTCTGMRCCCAPQAGGAGCRAAVTPAPRASFFALPAADRHCGWCMDAAELLYEAQLAHPVTLRPLSALPRVSYSPCRGDPALM